MAESQLEDAGQTPRQRKTAWRERLGECLGSEGFVEGARLEFKGLSRTERLWRSEILAIAAVERGMREELMLALEECSPNTMGEYRQSLLHKAAAGGWVQLIGALVGAGASVDGREVFGETPMCRAAEAGHVDAVAELVRLGASASLGARRKREQRGREACHGPLHIAAASGQVQLARLLIAAGADIRAPNGGGLAPIELALAHPAMVEALSALDPKWHAREALKNGLFHKACALGHVESAEILLRIEGAAAAVNEIWFVKSALHAASANGHAKCVEMLIGRGVAPNKRDGWGNTPLMEACRGIGAKGALPTIRTLLSAGASPALANQHGETALRILVAMKNDTQAQDATQWAEREAAMLVALPLVAAGVDLEKEDRSGKTPALAAAIAGQWAAVKALHALGADVGQERVLTGGMALGFPMEDISEGCSPALICAARGDLAGMLALHELGVDIFAANKQGVDARALAGRYGRKDILGVLACIQEKKELSIAAEPSIKARAHGPRL